MPVVAVLVCSAFLDDTLVLGAETVAIFATSNSLAEAHGMTSALDFFAGVGFSVAKLAGTAVIVVAAFFPLARVLVALPVVVVSFLAILVRVAVDFGAKVVLADGVLAVLSAVCVCSALDWDTVVGGADVGGFRAKVQAIIMRQAIDVDASVAGIFTSADLFVSAVFSSSALNIVTVVFEADLLGVAVIVRGAINCLASVTVASLSESTMVVSSALLSLTNVVQAEAMSSAAVVSEAGFGETVARGVTNALDVFALTADLVALGNAVVQSAVLVKGTLSIDALVFDTSLVFSASAVSDASDLLANVVFADFAVGSIAVAVLGTLLGNANVGLAKLFRSAERVASAFNFLACVGLSIADFRDRSVAVGLGSALDGSAFWKTVFSALAGLAVGEALGGLESTVVVWDGFGAVGVSRALGFDALVVVASFFIVAVIGGDACLDNASVRLAKTLALLAEWVGVALASSVADAVDSLAGVLGRVLLVWSVAKGVAGAISVGSALSWFTDVIDADLLGTALIVLVASNSVAGVLELFGRVLVVASPGVSAFLALAVAVGSALDSYALFVLALGLGATLSVRSAGLGTVIVFVVAFEGWVSLGVVVAKTTVGAVRVLGAFLFDTLSAFALAFAIGTFAREFGFAGKVTETLVDCALVVVANTGFAAVRFGETFNWSANGGVASLWPSISSRWAVGVASAVDILAYVLFADLGCSAVGTILAMVSAGALNFGANVALAVFDRSTVGAIVAVLVVGAADLVADLLLGEGVEVADVLIVANVDAVSSSSAGVLSESLGDLERETATVAFGVGDEPDLGLVSESVPSVAPCLLAVLLGVWELVAIHDQERIILSVWSAEVMRCKLLAKFRKGLDLHVVIAAVLAPVDVHVGELEGEGGDAFVVGENLPVKFFVGIVVLNDNLVSRSNVLVIGVERKSLSLGGGGGGSSDGGLSCGSCFGSGLLSCFSLSLLLATFAGKGGDY